MCFTIPGKIESIKKGVATVDEDKKIDLGLVTKVKVGDWILHNGDRAVKKISKKDAKTLIKIIG
jgi:hydrogenase assembly chaperone HypC/HupF